MFYCIILGDYEKYSKYLSLIIEKPDYILDDNKNTDTVIYMKTIIEEQKNIQIVVKLNTNKKNIYYQNSILTFWKIKEKTYNQMIKNKEIIYSRFLDKI